MATEGKGKGKGLSLPSGGGTFKGFGFVVVENELDGERMLREWSWDGGEVKMETDEEGNEFTRGARASGMRANS